MRKDYLIYEIYQKGQLMTWSSGEKRKKGKKNLYKEIMTRTSQICTEIQIPKFMKLIGDQAKSTKKKPVQDTL